MAKDYDEDMLTEEERAALEVDGDDAGELDGTDPDTGEDAADKQAAADAGEEEDEGADGDDDAAPAPESGAEEVDPVDPDADAAADKGAAAEEEDDPAPAPQQPPRPNIDIAAVEETIANHKADRKALLEEFNNGDLTDDEYEAKLDALDETVADAHFQKRVAEDYARQETQQWERAVKQHMGRYPEFQDSNAALTAFDRMVREVTKDPDYANMSFAEQLENAHALLEVKAQKTGIEGVPALKARAQANPKPKAEEKRTAPKGEDLGGPPRTLAHAPASEITDNDDEFSTLRAIEKDGDPDEFEEAMARLSPSDRDRYSSMA